MLWLDFERGKRFVPDLSGVAHAISRAQSERCFPESYRQHEMPISAVRVGGDGATRIPFRLRVVRCTRRCVRCCLTKVGALARGAPQDFVAGGSGDECGLIPAECRARVECSAVAFRERNYTRNGLSTAAGWVEQH